MESLRYGTSYDSAIRLEIGVHNNVDTVYFFINILDKTITYQDVTSGIECEITNVSFQGTSFSFMVYCNVYSVSAGSWYAMKCEAYGSFVAKDIYTLTFEN